MTARTYPYEPTVPCDICHALGSFDVMGDNLCDLCLMEEEVQVNRDPGDETSSLTYPQRNE